MTGGGQGGGCGGHFVSEGSHEDNWANNNSGSIYCSDGEGDTRHDGRNPRNRQEPVLRVTEGDPYDLVGPPTFGYRIRLAQRPAGFVLPTSKNMTVKQT